MLNHNRTMNLLTRRTFVRQSATWGVTASLLAMGSSRAAAPVARKMTLCLVGGMIGVRADQRQAIELAHAHGFESVEANGGYLASLNDAQVTELLADMKTKGIVFGASGLSVEFRREEVPFTETLKGLPKIAAGLQRAGVTRVGTWISPGSNTLTYLQNFKQHAHRLREVAKILKDHKVRFGLEYVATKTSRDRSKYPFLHTMAEMKELIAEIGTGNVGFMLDSWHWWQAGDTVEDILSLKGDQVVHVHLNDAPAEVAKEAQLDNRRELPVATGVIDAGAFLSALNQIGYDGPVCAEPFSQSLNALDDGPACAATIAALKKAAALIR
jgi:sugar phosphate isomerase/epimerase